MAHQVVWAKCSVDNPETGESVILTKGETLPEWVTDYTLFVLTSTGGAKHVEDEAPPVAPPPVPVRLPEHPPLTSDLALAEKDTLAGQAAARLRANGPSESGRPRDYAPKPAWVDYAVSKRDPDVTEDEARVDAESKTKEQLIAECG